MSTNIFQINPIFCLPIDLEDNSQNKEEDITKGSIINNFIKNNKKIKENPENDSTNEDSSSSKELDQSLDSGEIQKENTNKTQEKKEKEYIIFSKSKNDPHIKSMTNSSKIYICEIFKQNWKLKARRLITKLKKKLIKEYQKSLIEEHKNKIKNETINENQNEENNINSKIYNNYINNNNIIINNMYKNEYINMNHTMYNELNINENPSIKNACTNKKINFNQFDNVYQIYNNQNFINNKLAELNEIEQLKKLIILNNICY